MNGLATLLTQKGFRVRGTDPSIDGATRTRLEMAGIDVFTTQDGSTITNNTQLVVTTAALPPTHPELTAAQEKGIPVIKYAAMLGVVMNSFTGIAVAGTHGKTSTSALTVAALRGAGLDPGFVIGGYIEQFGAGAHGGNTYLVAEACEYDRSFYNLHPKIAVITNIEADHLDIYADLNDIIDSFAHFVENLPNDGKLIYCAESPAAKKLASRFSGHSVSYGFTDAMFTATNIQNQNNQLIFQVTHNNTELATISLRLPGHHNVLNALASFVAGLQLGISAKALARGISEFSGVNRRFEQIGIARDITVIDDYAHHPTEIRAMLQGARQRFTTARIVVAFQPHQISRTKFFFTEFAAAFKLADHVLLPDIYIARDIERPADINSKNLAVKIQEAGTDATYTESFENTTATALWLLQPGDVFITVGAGNIYDVAHRVLSALQK